MYVPGVVCILCLVVLVCATDTAAVGGGNNQGFSQALRAAVRRYPQLFQCPETSLGKLHRKYRRTAIASVMKQHTRYSTSRPLLI